MPRGDRRWVAWLLLVVSLLGAAYCAGGYVMMGSFTISNPERLAHWRRVGTLYGVMVIGCLVAAAALSVHLVRTRRGRTSSPA